MSELRSCPFCGGKAVMTERSVGWTVDCEHNDPIWVATNEDSYCSFEMGLCATKEQATLVWNNRPLEDALTAENARLRSLIQRMAEVGDELSELSNKSDSACNHWCICCRHSEKFDKDIIHAPSCPVTRWKELKKEVNHD